MAYAINTYTGDGTTDTFSVTFPYISTTDVVVTIDGVTKTLTTDYTFATSSTIQFTSPPAGSTTIKFTRSSNRTARLVDYQDGSTITESILDQDSNQMFYMAQEAIDITEDNISKSAATDQWDAESKRITNVADPTAAQDAATKNYLENTWLTSADKTALTTVKDNITNINSVNSNSSNINTVAGVSANVTTVANNITSVNTVATDITKVVAVANDLAEAVSEVETVADDLNEATSEIDTVAGAITNVDLVGTNIANVNLVGGSITNVNNVGNDIANVNTVAGNIAGVNSFGDRYRVSSSAPASSLDVGDLYFDTTANELKVYKSSGWAAAGSTVNGTAQRYNYTATAAQTTFTGADTNGNTLAYDAGYADVYLNGVRLSGADITITSGTSVVLAVGASAGDILDVVAYGTFDVASINAANIDAGTLNNARLSSDVTQNTATQTLTNKTINGSNNTISNVPNSALVGTGAITINGSAVALGGSVTVGETKPTATGCTPSTITNDATNVVIAGTNFTSIPQVWAINTSTGIWYTANSVTYTSATSITANFTLLVDASYKIRVENPDGNAALSSTNILTVSDAPTWSTASGSLGTIAGNFSGTVATLSASSDSAVTYSETTSVLTNASQANCALNSSTGAITTSDFGGSSTTATLYTFTIRATDAEGQTVDREFTLTSSFSIEGSGGFN